MIRELPGYGGWAERVNRDREEAELFPEREHIIVWRLLKAFAEHLDDEKTS